VRLVLQAIVFDSLAFLGRIDPDFVEDFLQSQVEQIAIFAALAPTPRMIMRWLSMSLTLRRASSERRMPVP
jgi:hypothetical protein